MLAGVDHSLKVRVELTLDHELVECGGQVRGTLTWAGNRGLDQVRVVLRYRTEGRADIDSAVIDHCGLGQAESGRARFQLDVPPLGPVTYHGQLLRLLWQIAVAVPVTKASVRVRGGLAFADLTVALKGWLQRPGA